jgi:FMN phosphatase YigB (HAD superfamily)
LIFPNTQIRWLFFDLGNTLINEEPATEVRLRKAVSCFQRHGRHCSVAAIRSALQEASAAFAPRLITAAIAKLTDDPDLRRAIVNDARYPKDLETPYEGAGETLRALAQCYRIGVIANQSLGTEERLTNWGLMPLIWSASPPLRSVLQKQSDQTATTLRQSALRLKQVYSIFAACWKRS